MPKSPNQKMKPLLLQRILLERTDEDHGLTVPELIALLEEEGVAAERKSVYSDLQTLADFGLDIVKRKESGKVVYYGQENKHSAVGRVNTALAGQCTERRCAQAVLQQQAGAHRSAGGKLKSRCVVR